MNDRLISFRSIEPFVSHEGRLGAIGLYSMEWVNISDCSSNPEFKLQHSILPQASSRSVVHDVGNNLSNLKSWGFKKVSSEMLPNDGQLFVAKILDYSPERKVTRSYEQTSRYVSDSYKRHNPAYDVALLEMQKAARDLAIEEAEVSEFAANCTAGFWECVLAGAVFDNTDQLEENLEAKKRKLRSTPTTLTEKVYSDYSVTKLEIAASKSGSVVMALIDFDRGINYLDELPFNERKSFTVINSPIHQSDPNSASLRANTSSEKEIDKWMREPPKINEDLSSLLVNLVSSATPQKAQAATQISQAKKWSQGKRMSDSHNFADIGHSIDEHSVENVVSGKQGRYGERHEGIEKLMQASAIRTSKPANYKLEDSIVVVKTLTGAGSGFYISPKEVLTNAHVVGDSEFVQMRDFDGEQMTGEVIKRDLGSDLALVSVTRQAIPLTFSKGCEVNRREEVFTIGHPKGYEYSTTRGIVSSIRNMENPISPAAGKYSYVQIDAPISQGNSGGPLFNSSENVIGINTFTRIDGQNLNFAVHCLEIMRFLK